MKILQRNIQKHAHTRSHAHTHIIFKYMAIYILCLNVHRVSKKTSTHIIGYKLRNNCPILIIFDIKIPHII